jgi:hypothetical protein
MKRRIQTRGKKLLHACSPHASNGELAARGRKEVFVGRDETLQRGVHDFIRRELGVRGHLDETLRRLHIFAHGLVLTPGAWVSKLLFYRAGVLV